MDDDLSFNTVRIGFFYSFLEALNELQLENKAKSYRAVIFVIAVLLTAN